MNDEDDRVDSSDLPASSSGQRIFSEPPGSDISDFIQAFDDDDGILEDLQPLSRLNMKYDDCNGRSVFCVST